MTKCDHEFFRYFCDEIYDYNGRRTEDFKINAGISICHKCRTICLVFPGDETPTYIKAK